MNKKIILIGTLSLSCFAMGKYVNVMMPESEINHTMTKYINIIKTKGNELRSGKEKNNYTNYCNVGEGVSRDELIEMIDSGKNVENVCTSNIKDFSDLFYSEREGATEATRLFNQDISRWDVSNGKSFSMMFYGAKNFNQNIGIWDVSSGQFFDMMFLDAVSFNQDISRWDVSNGLYFSSFLFNAKSFNQDIHLWDVEKAKDSEDFRVGSMLSLTNTPADFGGTTQDMDKDGVSDHKEIYNGTDPYNKNSK